jgi:hypothetical protein
MKDNKSKLDSDFFSNCGMARVFVFHGEEKVQIEDESVFSDTSDIIKNAIAKHML